MTPANGSAPTEAAQVRAAGRTVTLADGSIIGVRFSFAAIMEVEARFGNVATLARQLASNLAGPLYKAVAEVLSIMTGDPVAAVAGRLDPSKVIDYAAAIDEALDEALPSVEAGEVPKAPPSPSDGPASTTSGPSSTTGATPTSGG